MTGPETVQSVVDVVRRVREHGPVILIGHSLGGLAVTGTGNEIPNLVDHLVYIAAHIPVTKPAGEYLSAPEWGTSELLPATMPIIMGNPAELGYIRLNWRTTDRAVLERLKIALGVSDDELFVQVLNGMQPDEVFWQTDPTFGFVAGKDTWGRIPRSYIRLTEDRSMPPAVQDMYIREAATLTPDNLFDVHSISSGHGTFLRDPAEIADILAALRIA